MANKVYNDLDSLFKYITESKKENKSQIITEKLKEKVKRLILIDDKEFEKTNKFKCEGVKIDLVFADICTFDINNNQIVIKNGKDKEITIDFDDTDSTIVYCKSGYLNEEILYLLNKLTYLGFTVINNPKWVQISSNKYVTAKLFDEFNIPQPKYIVVSEKECIDDIEENTENFDEYLRKIYEEENEDNEYVCKILNGHKGHGVFICKEKNILSVLQCVFTVGKHTSSQPLKIICQEKLNIDEGDVRAYILNINDKQELVDCILRKKSSDDFRTNMALGNEITKFHLNPEYLEVAKKAIKVSGLKFAGVDLYIDKENKEAYVIKINGIPEPPIPVNTNEEESKKINEEFYTKVINTINQMINGI